MYLYIQAVISNDVLVKYPTVMAFDVNVTMTAAAAAAADVVVAAAAVAVVANVAVMTFVSDPYTIQMKIHFRTVALPSNVYLGHYHLLTVVAVATMSVVRPVFCQTIQMIYHDSCRSDFVKSPKYFECLF